MKYFLLPLLAALFLFSCTNKKPVNDLLKPSRLPSQLFSIDAGKETIIKTSHGSRLKIASGTFKTTGAVTIEIKEAFTPKEIFLAGLTTISDGQPLRSAGMIYFNATAEGKQIEPQIPVETFIPASDVDNEMKLFKGEFNGDSVVNWTQPQVIDTPKKKSETYLLGRWLFLNKCNSCHSPFKEGTGPRLKDVQYRGPWKNPNNLKAWINNPALFMARDPYTQNLKRVYGSFMTAYPEFTHQDIAAILEYINSVPIETYEREADSVSNIIRKAFTDTTSTHSQDCGTDSSYVFSPNNFPEYDTTNVPDIFSEDSTAWDYTINVNDTSIVNNYEYPDYSKEGYEFEINTNGWYNVDAFLKIEENVKKIVNVKLDVDIVTSEDIYMNVFLTIPSERVLQSIYKKKGNKYILDFENGTAPLPINEQGVIFTYGSLNDKIYYGTAEFTIKESQTISITTKEVTKEELEKVLEMVELKATKKELITTPIPCDGPKGGRRRSVPLIDTLKKVVAPN